MPRTKRALRFRSPMVSTISLHMSKLHIGISGWTYPSWRGIFYPRGLPHRQELEYVSQKMNSVEINGSFYSLLKPDTYRRWFDETPPGFCFAVKGSRFITHMKKLKDIETPLANFFASGVLRLGEKLGPFLWQFPPNLQFNEVRFLNFLKLLPRTAEEAAALAAHHDERLTGRAWTQAEYSGSLRHAFEVRHPSFFTPAFVDLLRQHDVALVFADTAGIWPYEEDVTSDFIYLRLHGAEHLYASGYTDTQLDWWAERIQRWRVGLEPPDARRIVPHPASHGPRDVYVYFDNDARVQAPFDAQRLLWRLRSGTEEPG